MHMGTNLDLNDIAANSQSDSDSFNMMRETYRLAKLAAKKYPHLVKRRIQCSCRDLIVYTVTQYVTSYKTNFGNF